MHNILVSELLTCCADIHNSVRSTAHDLEVSADTREAFGAVDYCLASQDTWQRDCHRLGDACKGIRFGKCCLRICASLKSAVALPDLDWSCSDYCFRTTGSCYLQDLPEHLLYQVTGLLDIYSQRNLFLCSSQLYSRWHLQIPDDNFVWRYIRSCIDLIAANVSSGLCVSASLSFVLSDIITGKHSDTRFTAALKFRPSNRDSTMMVARCQYPRLPLKWIEMTKDQFWHCLVG